MRRLHSTILKPLPLGVQKPIPLNRKLGYSQPWWVPATQSGTCSMSLSKQLGVRFCRPTSSVRSWDVHLVWRRATTIDFEGRDYAGKAHLHKQRSFSRFERMVPRENWGNDYDLNIRCRRECWHGEVETYKTYTSVVLGCWHVKFARIEQESVNTYLSDILRP